MKNKGKKKFLHSRRDSGTAETLETPPPPEICEEPEIDNYPQVETSPYTTRAINLLIGSPAEQYTIPEYYLQPYPKLHIDAWNQTLLLRDISPDIGHTLVHYLCTGTYETTKPSPPITSRRLIEFRRSVHVYKAARVYEIPGLEQLAKQYIETFEDNVSLFDILTVIREVQLPEQEVWFVEHLVHRMSAALAADEDGFQSDLLAYGIGRDADFDPLVLKIVLLLYHGRRYPSDSVHERGDKGYVVNGTESPSPVDPDDEEVPEPLPCEEDEYAVPEAPEEVSVPLEPEPEPTPPEELGHEEAVLEAVVPEDTIAEEPAPEEPSVEAPPDPVSPPLSPVYHQSSDKALSSKGKKGKKKKPKHLAATSEPQPEPEPEFHDPPFKLQRWNAKSFYERGGITHVPVKLQDY